MTPATNSDSQHSKVLCEDSPKLEGDPGRPGLARGTLSKTTIHQSGKQKPLKQDEIQEGCL